MCNNVAHSRHQFCSVNATVCCVYIVKFKATVNRIKILNVVKRWFLATSVAGNN
jgi:hypothetical protein